MRFFNSLFVALGLTFILASCSGPKDITYFQDLNPGEEISVTSVPPIRLEPNDKLMIIVSTGDGRLNQLFNLPVANSSLGNAGGSGAGSTMSSSNGVAPYTIDKQGNINFPVLGKLHIAGMTREQVAEYIRQELVSRDLAKNPIVTVEFMNLTVSILGEVGSPGRYPISREDYTILDALADAGDLTIVGKRGNIKVIRRENGTQKAYNVDMSDSRKLAQSPVYYLQQNDIIYVEPNATKKNTATPNGNLWSTPSIWITLLSTGISVATLVMTLTK